MAEITISMVCPGAKIISSTSATISTMRPTSRIGPALSMLTLVVMPSMVSAKKKPAHNARDMPMVPRSYAMKMVLSEKPMIAAYT